jgi:uncharacterized small protein (DUF1192 family)
MPKTRKRAEAPEAPISPQVGDKVTKPRSESVLEITHVSKDGEEVNLNLPGTNLERFRVRTDTLTFVERKPPARTSNPFTHAEPVLDVGEVMKRIAVVQEENLKRLDDDIDILKTYLKTQRAPKAAIEALEGLIVQQHVSWKKTIERIEKLLEE